MIFCACIVGPSKRSDPLFDHPPILCSGLDDAATVRALAPNDIDKLKNAQLKQALTTSIGDTQNEPSNAVLLEELRSVKQIVAEVTSLKKQVTQLSEKLDHAYQVIHQQQLFLKSLDSKERQCNLIITGLTEDADEMGDTDDAKIQKVLEATGCSEALERIRWARRRREGQMNAKRDRS
ncbi:hypothetical protein E2C01_077606 [Portunus trituberculatus]|uniref:Uncharacterized protein n=1 Tax=Portunus trituberculatus TaxID=210409 RepID=A0A5B7IMI8_PORTR|nr:hypothetical protein [Portunus trituberculatus]